MKIQLERTKVPRFHAPGNATTHLTMALPFYRSNWGRFGGYIHRVRAGHVHWRNGEMQHISLTMWCGAHGFLPTKGEVMASVPKDGFVCATCEGRATGAGALGAAEINGVPVIYSPRKARKELAAWREGRKP